jgi:hypothetical protein
MKLPLLIPVTSFAGGILLSGKMAIILRLTPRICLIAILILLISGYVLLQRSWIVATAILSACAWMFLGFAAASLGRASVSPNLAGTLIETGKLDASTALRWRGRLRADPLQLPWGTRYEIALDEVESSAGITQVTGGLRLTSYSNDTKRSPSHRHKPGIRWNAWFAFSPSEILAIPAASIIEATLRARTLNFKARSGMTSF